MKLIHTQVLRGELGSDSVQNVAKKYNILVAELSNFIYSHIDKNGVYPVDNVRNKGKRFSRTQLNEFKSLYDMGVTNINIAKHPEAIKTLKEQFKFVCALTGLKPEEVIKKYIL